MIYLADKRIKYKLKIRGSVLSVEDKGRDFTPFLEHLLQKNMHLLMFSLFEIYVNLLKAK